MGEGIAGWGYQAYRLGDQLSYLIEGSTPQVIKPIVIAHQVVDSNGYRNSLACIRVSGHERSLAFRRGWRNTDYLRMVQALEDAEGVFVVCNNFLSDLSDYVSKARVVLPAPRSDIRSRIEPR